MPAFPPTRLARNLLIAFVLVGHGSATLRADSPEVWKRHTIDASSRGADGVRLADVNGDGRMDLVTGWEEGGRIGVCVHPGPKRVRQLWPSVTVGKVRSPEDAVFADIDGDGRMDVVSSCEGRERTMFVHWAPKSAADYLQEKAWRTEAIPATRGKQMWMFAAPAELDGKGGIDLFVGAKGGNAAVGVLFNPGGRQLDAWRYVRLCDAGWIMSLVSIDLDRDGDPDLVFSDRKGPNRGVWWLENPGREKAGEDGAWKRSLIGGRDCEVMFLDVVDLDGDKTPEVVTATRNGKILIARQSGNPKMMWRESEIKNPFSAPNGKAVRAGDLDLDGRPDLVHTVNNGGKRQFPGATWLSNALAPGKAKDISGKRGVKFDLIQLLDLDEDGDLDVITCEERDNLGVFWYENPAR